MTLDFFFFLLEIRNWLFTSLNGILSLQKDVVERVWLWTQRNILVFGGKWQATFTCCLYYLIDNLKGRCLPFQISCLHLLSERVIGSPAIWKSSIPVKARVSPNGVTWRSSYHLVKLKILFRFLSIGENRY